MCSCVSGDFISKINVKYGRLYLVEMLVNPIWWLCAVHSLQQLTRAKRLLKCRLPMFCIDNYLQRDISLAENMCLIFGIDIQIRWHRYI